MHEKTDGGGGAIGQESASRARGLPSEIKRDGVHCNAMYFPMEVQADDVSSDLRPKLSRFDYGFCG